MTKYELVNLSLCQLPARLAKWIYQLTIICRTDGPFAFCQLMELNFEKYE